MVSGLHNSTATRIPSCWQEPPQTISVERRAGRTDLYTGRGTLMTLRESIELNERNGAKHTPELKSGNPNRIRAVFGSQSQFAPR